MANTKKGSQTPTEFPITFDLVTGSIQDEGALAAIAAAGGGGSTPLINNLTSTSATSALTAAMGKSLKDSTDNLTTVVSQKVVIGGDLGGTAAAPVVAKVNGVTVTGTPTSGQVLTASSGSAASWQAPSGGGGGGGGSTTINNTLTSTSTTEALSAAMGKALKDGLDAVAGGGGGASIPVLRTIDTTGRTLAAADLGNLVRYNSASNANFTIPTDATLGITDANANVSIELYQIGTGRLDIVADTANGVTLNKWVGYPTSTQFVSQTVHRVAPNTWAVK